ncbi:MAG: hypothetical protein B7X53_11420, partial [Hyphomonas sp. 34-62-18]
MSRLLMAGVSALLLAACSEAPVAAPATDPVDTPIEMADPGSPPAPMSASFTAPLPDFFNCLRE